MYLSFGWHGPARGMPLKIRAAKIHELWRQLNWLEDHVEQGSRYLVGNQLTLADFTWFPTCVFMEYMLPNFFGWPQLFDPGAPPPQPFPKLAAWYAGLRADEPAFASVHAEIWNYWRELDSQGQFLPIQSELASPEAEDLKFTYGKPQTVTLNYQEPPPEGKVTGRYINQPDKGDVVDESVAKPVLMHDARELEGATFESKGFELVSWPTAVADFTDDDAIVKTYYDEMIKLIKDASGADRVLVFDHTVRKSTNTNLNASSGGSAAPVPRVHCDYTVDGAPRRLMQLAEEGIFSRLRGRTLTIEDVAELAKGRFAFINVWRSISDTDPVLQSPLAVADESTVPDEDRFLYELRFPDRTGENYSLRHSSAHRWYYYPKMVKDECLVFKVYDKKEDGPRFVFHTSFTEIGPAADRPPRESIEIRAVAFFDCPHLE
jgi:hypothetical protein